MTRTANATIRAMDMPVLDRVFDMEETVERLVARPLGSRYGRGTQGSGWRTLQARRGNLLNDPPARATLRQRTPSSRPGRPTTR